MDQNIDFEQIILKTEVIEREIEEMQEIIELLRDEVSQGAQLEIYTEEYRYYTSQMTVDLFLTIDSITVPGYTLKHVVNAILIIFGKPLQYREFLILTEDKREFISSLKNLDIQKIPDSQILECQQYIQTYMDAFEPNLVIDSSYIINYLANCCNLIVQIHNFYQQLQPLWKQLEQLYHQKLEKCQEINHLEQLRVQLIKKQYNSILTSIQLNQFINLLNLQKMEIHDMLKYINNQIHEIDKQIIQQDKLQGDSKQKLLNRLNQKNQELQSQFTRQAQARLNFLINPPQLIIKILKAIQIILDVDETISTGRLMLKDPELVQILINFNPLKDLKRKNYEKAKKYVKNNQLKSNQKEALNNIYEIMLLNNFFFSCLESYEINEQIQKQLININKMNKDLELNKQGKQFLIQKLEQDMISTI